MPMWIAGISIYLLAAAGIVAIARSIPASHANIPDDSRRPSREAVPGGAEGAPAKNLQSGPAAGPTVNKPRNGVRCPECGVVESIRTIEPSRDINGQGAARAKVEEADAGGASDAAIVADAVTANTYEITVRFRDGSRAVLNEATPRSWRLGSRVMVIGRSSLRSARDTASKWPAEAP
jgi:hypothetical protein